MSDGSMIPFGPGVTRRMMIAGAATMLTVPHATFAGTDGSLTMVGDRLFTTVVLNGIPLTALLDTAAEASVLDSRIADRLGLGGGHSVVARGTGAATVAARLVPGVTFAAAGMIVRSATVGVIDLAEVGRRLLGRPIDMILGADFFRADAILIDPAGGRLHRAGVADRHRGHRMALVESGGAMLMPATVEEHQLLATFDLGNGNEMLVSHRLAGRLMANGRAVGHGMGGGIGGLVGRELLVLRSVRLAGRVFADVLAAVHDVPGGADANIGMRLLRHFRMVADVRRLELRLF